MLNRNYTKYFMLDGRLPFVIIDIKVGLLDELKAFACEYDVNAYYEAFLKEETKRSQKVAERKQTKR